MTACSPPSLVRRVFVVRPAHNPIGPLDLGGAFDERSDRRQGLGRTDRSRLRGRVPAVHRTGGRRERGSVGKRDARRELTTRRLTGRAGDRRPRSRAGTAARGRGLARLSAVGLQAAETVAERRHRHDRLRHGAVAARRCRSRRSTCGRIRRRFASSRGSAPRSRATRSRLPTTIVHFTSSSCRKKSATYGMKSSRGLSPRNAQNTCSREPSRLRGADDILEPLHRDFRALHLADHRGVGERVEVRERLEIDAVRLAVEEQRVGLDGVEHRRRGALRDVHVYRAQVLGEDRAGGSVVGAGCP